MNFKYYIYVLLSLVVSFAGCKSNQRLSHNHSHSSKTTIKPSSVRYSQINLPFRVKKSLLTEFTNNALDSVLTNQALPGAEGFDVDIRRSDDTRIELSEKDILAAIPLKIKVAKNILVANVEAEGEVILMTSTAVDVDPFWNVTTKSELVNVEWVQPMKVSSGFIGISVQAIADKLINANKEMLCRKVDEALMQKLKIQGVIDSLATRVRRPIQIHDLYDGYVQISPDTIGLAGFRNRADDVENTIMVNVNAKLHSNKPDNSAFRGLPRFEWQQNEAGISTLQLPVEITYDQIEKITKQYLIGQTFSDGDRSIEILDLEVGHDKQRIIANAKVKGSVNGIITISGVPKYNQTKAELYADDIDVKLNSKNLAQKTAVWLGKGVIRKKLEESLSISIKDQIDNIQQLIDYNLDTMIGPLVDFKADVKSIDVEDFLMLDEHIQATLFLDAELFAELKAVK